MGRWLWIAAAVLMAGCSTGTAAPKIGFVSHSEDEIVYALGANGLHVCDRFGGGPDITGAVDEHHLTILAGRCPPPAALATIPHGDLVVATYSDETVRDAAPGKRVVGQDTAGWLYGQFVVQIDVATPPDMAAVIDTAMSGLGATRAY